MTVIEALSLIVKCKEEDGELYLRVGLDTLDKDALFDKIIACYEEHNVINGDLNAIRAVVNRASGEFELVGQTLDEYSDDYDSYLIVSACPTQATLFIKQNISTKITVALLRFRLLRAGVFFGIREHILADIIANRSWDLEIPVAFAQHPILGEDSKIEYLVSTTRNLTPKIGEDGNVDYREVRAFALLKKGDIIARKTLPTQGVQGKAITGKVIPCSDGKEAAFFVNDNMIVTEDGLFLLADINGVLTENKGEYFLREHLEIDGNVDFTTGNIYYSGKIIINGDVWSGFTVESDDDIMIRGMVEAANIHSRNGSITILCAVSGKNNATIRAKKDIIIHHAQEAIIESEATVNVENSLVHCTVQCKDLITNNNNGTVIGGRIEATQSIQIARSGNVDGTSTALCITTSHFRELQSKQGQLLNLQNKVHKQLLDTLYDRKNRQQFLEQMGALFLPQQRLLLDKIEKHRQELESKENLINHNLAIIEKSLGDTELNDCFIKVSHTLHSGTRIQIGIPTKEIKFDEFARRYFLKNGLLEYFTC